MSLVWTRYTAYYWLRVSRVKKMTIENRDLKIARNRNRKIAFENRDKMRGAGMFHSNSDTDKDLTGSGEDWIIHLTQSKLKSITWTLNHCYPKWDTTQCKLHYKDREIGSRGTCSFSALYFITLQSMLTNCLCGKIVQIKQLEHPLIFLHSTVE